jgi:hypothetical protein
VVEHLPSKREAEFNPSTAKKCHHHCLRGPVLMNIWDCQSFEF